MRLAHYLEMRVFCKEEDNREQILGKTKEIFSLDKTSIEEKASYGFDKKKIVVITAYEKSAKRTNAVLQNLMQRLSDEQRDLLLKQQTSRLDENLDFYFRLEKDKFLNGESWITDSGDCFHFKISVAAYPHNRETAIYVLKEILSLGKI